MHCLEACTHTNHHLRIRTLSHHIHTALYTEIQKST